MTLYKRNVLSGLIVACVFMTRPSSATPLVAQGESDYRIYSSPSATKTEQYAAEVLQSYIHQISGCMLPIVRSVEANGKLIYVGFHDAPSTLTGNLDIESFGKEEYIIQQSGEALLIAGGQPRGTLYGVIGLLRDHFGCRWYTREVVKTPKGDTLRLEGLPVRAAPVFAYREPWYRETYDMDFAVFNRINSSMVPIPEERGGNFIIYPFVHTFNMLVPPDEYFGEHPEYFSLVDGERRAEHTGTQLCLTNPEVLQIATATVLRWIAEHPNAEVFSIDQNDGYGPCECPGCSAIDVAEGSGSGTILNFVNQIADTVAEKHPEVRLQTLAYVYSEQPPKTVRPRPNVTVRMCHYEYCEAHAIGQCDEHLPFVERLEGWSKITDSITIWDYFTNFRHYLIPYPNLESVITHPRFYAERSCIGLFAQGNNVREQGGGEFSGLRAWVFAQLMWDPFQDGRALINEFVENVYGPAAPHITAYIREAKASVQPQDLRFSIFSSLDQMTYLTPEFLDRADGHFRDALAAAQDDPALIKRVELAHLPIHYARLQFYAAGGAEYLREEEMPAVLNVFERVMTEHKIRQFGENLGGDSLVATFVEEVKQAPRYITDWQVIGPFDNTDRAGFDAVYPPETDIDIDTAKEYTGSGGKPVRWRAFEPGRTGYVDLARVITPPETGVAYACRTFEVAQDTTLNVSLGSNDGVKLWLNGELLLSSKASRTARPGDESLTLPLKKGKNTVLLKIDQLGGGWGFYFSTTIGDSN